MMKVSGFSQDVRSELLALQRAAVASGLSPFDLRVHYNSIVRSHRTEREYSGSPRRLAFAAVIVFISVALSTQLGFLVDSGLQTRCLVSNNYLVWEATRPISDCAFCRNVTAPMVLKNVTRKSFEPYAYTSRPVIVKGGAAQWQASQHLHYAMFKKLYEDTVGGYESAEEGCQFLSFKSDVFTLREVFEMSDARASNVAGEAPWYVGWGNCHPDILAKVRQYYDYPDFLPEDAEFPSTENIFFGYEMGAVMHLDYIPRLMWQGQVRGNKTWSVVPIPECEDVCSPFQFYVEPGDIVLLDTRVWYHATRIPPGQFSITVQSEYG